MVRMANIKAVLPKSSVLSGEAPQESKEETVSSFADLAAHISGVVPFFVFGCKEDHQYDVDDDILAGGGLLRCSLSLVTVSVIFDILG